MSHERSHKLTGIGYSCQLTAVETRNPLTSVKWQNRSLRRRSRERWRPKKLYRLTWVNFRMQLTSLQFDVGNPFYCQLTAVKARYLLTMNL